MTSKNIVNCWSPRITLTDGSIHIRSHDRITNTKWITHKASISWIISMFHLVLKLSTERRYKKEEARFDSFFFVSCADRVGEKLMTSHGSVLAIHLSIHLPTFTYPSTGYSFIQLSVCPRRHPWLRFPSATTKIPVHLNDPVVTVHELWKNRRDRHTVKSCEQATVSACCWIER